MMKKVLVFAALMCALVLPSSSSSMKNSVSASTCETIYLLNVVPYPDNSTFAGWDRGFELIPAGHLAARHINSDPTILSEYNLEVINVASEACGRSLIIEGYLDYYVQSLGQTKRCVYGVVGLYCSTVTHTIAPVANHPNIGYVQLAASTSPLHRDTQKFPHTFHTIASSRVFNEAMIALMDAFNWKKVHAVFDSLGFLFISTAIDFARQIRNETDKTLISNIGIQPRHDSIGRLFGVISNAAARIGYLSMSEDEIATFFCEAYKRQFLWPGYVYVMQERSVEQIRQVSRDCTVEQINQALEGAYLFQYRLSTVSKSKLVSGKYYQQYYDEYLDELQSFARAKEMNLKENPYANTLYDQVWAFALAANLSLDTINFFETTSSRNAVEHEINARNVLAHKLQQIEFEGASGFVKFGGAHEVQTSVEIYQIRNGTDVLIGEYDAHRKEVSFVRDFDKTVVPKDTFDVHYQLVQRWVGVIFILVDTALLILVIFNMIAIVYWRRKPEIKSGSVSLSLLILFGCCLLCVSPVFKTVTTILVISTSALFTILCNFYLWSFTCGNFLIFVALLVRLFRVFHIFRSYRAIGKYWSDKYLVVYIVAMLAGMILLLLLWTVFDTYHHIEERRYISAGRPPYFIAYSYCSSNSLDAWLIVFSSLIGVVMILLVFLAIQTRHIKRRHFKDTKKVNMFIFSVSVTYAIFLPLWLLLSAVDLNTAAYICQMLAIQVGAALCLAFLFLPKTIPLIRKLQ